MSTIEGFYCMVTRKCSSPTIYINDTDCVCCFRDEIPAKQRGEKESRSEVREQVRGQRAGQRSEARLS